MREQLTEVKGDLSVVRDSQTEIRDDLELMQNKLSNETDAKIQLIIEVPYPWYIQYNLASRTRL